MLMLFPVAALIIALVTGNTLGIVVSGAFLICTAGLIYVLGKHHAAVTAAYAAVAQNQELAQQLEEVRKNRDEYMALYKQYFNLYDAKVSECSILSHKNQELQDQLAISQMKEPAKQEETKEVQKTPRKRQNRGKKSVAEIKTDLLEKKVN